MELNKLTELNINLTQEFQTKLEAFASLFLQYNSHTNLISKNDEKYLFEKHIFDSLAINKLNILKNDISLLDIGTGGGFPSIPIAIFYPNIMVTAIDSINKKINFINEISDKLNLKNLKAICIRSEDLGGSYLEKFDIITTRAVDKLNVILEYAIPYLKVGGNFIAYKSILTDEEIKNAQKTLKILNAKITEIVDYKLPLPENFERKLIKIIKIQKTSPAFPRKTGDAKYKPL